VAACQTPGFRSDQIKLGVIYPDSGPLSGVLGPSRAGIEARIQEQNAAGGIHGRKIVYEWRDDAAEQGRNSQAARELVERENVFGILESTTASSGGADYLTEHNIPVAGLPSETLWAERNNMFAYSYVFTEGSSVDTFGQYVQSQGGTKAAVIDSDLERISTDISSKIEASLAAVNIPIVPENFVFNANVPDARRLAERIKASGADTVIVILAAARAAEIMDALRAVGADIKVFLSPNGYDRSLLDDFGPRVAGLSIFVNYLPFEADTEAHRRYLDSMVTYAPELAAPDQEIPLVSYIFTDLFLHGLEVAGPCPTREGFIQALRAVTDFDARGLLPGKVNLTESFGQIASCYTFLRVNEAGNAFDLIPNPNVPDGRSTQWCGSRI